MIYASNIPEPINFRIHAGATPEISVPVLDDADNPVVLTNATIVWVVTQNDQDKKAIITKRDSDGGILLENPTDDGFTILLDRVDTEELRGDYYHEARVEIAGLEDIVIYGTLTIQPTVTAGVV
jgi:hypothetical protein